MVPNEKQTGSAWQRDGGIEEETSGFGPENIHVKDVTFADCMTAKGVENPQAIMA